MNFSKHEKSKKINPKIQHTKKQTKSKQKQKMKNQATKTSKKQAKTGKMGHGKGGVLQFQTGDENKENDTRLNTAGIELATSSLALASNCLNKPSILKEGNSYQPFARAKNYPEIKKESTQGSQEKLIFSKFESQVVPTNSSQIADSMPKDDLKAWTSHKMVADSLINSGLEFRDETCKALDFGKLSGQADIHIERLWQILDARGSKNWKIFDKVDVFYQQMLKSVNLTESSSGSKSTQFSTLFIDCLCLLTTKPELIQQLIPDQTINENGVYIVWQYLQNQWRSTIIDDRVPIKPSSATQNPNSGKTAQSPLPQQELLITKFSKGSQLRNYEIWQLLLEKAAAKNLNFEYKKFFEEVKEGGLVSCFRAILGQFTGALTKESKIDDIKIRSFVTKNEVEYMNKLWNKLSKYKERGYLVSVYPRTKGKNFEKFDKNPKEKNGLELNHFYALDKLHHIENFKQTGHSHKLVKLKSGFMEDIWMGRWSPNWYEWTTELRSEVDPESPKPAENAIWMDFNTFISYFGTIVTAKIKPGYSHYCLPLVCSHQRITRIVIRVTYKTKLKNKVYISLAQNQQAGRRFGFFGVKMMLGKLHEGKFRFLSYSNSANSGETVMKKNLISGEYYLLVELSGSQNSRISSNLAFRADGRVGFKIIENEKESVLYDFLCYKTWDYYVNRSRGKKLSDLRVKNGKSDKSDQNDQNGLKFELTKMEVPGSSILAIKNPTDKLVKLKVEFSGPKGMEILGTGGDLDNTHTILMDGGCKEAFILRSKRSSDQALDLKKLKIRCSDIDIFYPPKPPIEKDLLVYDALLQDKPDLKSTTIHAGGHIRVLEQKSISKGLGKGGASQKPEKAFFGHFGPSIEECQNEDDEICQKTRIDDSVVPDYFTAGTTALAADEVAGGCSEAQNEGNMGLVKVDSQGDAVSPVGESRRDSGAVNGMKSSRASLKRLVFNCKNKRVSFFWRFTKFHQTKKTKIRIAQIPLFLPSKHLKRAIGFIIIDFFR